MRSADHLDAIDVFHPDRQILPGGVAAQRSIHGAPVDHHLEAPIMGVGQPVPCNDRRPIRPVRHQKTRHQSQQLVNLGKARGLDHLPVDDTDGDRRIERRLRHARRREHKRDVVEEHVRRLHRSGTEAERGHATEEGAIERQGLGGLQNVTAKHAREAQTGPVRLPPDRDNPHTCKTSGRRTALARLPPSAMLAQMHGQRCAAPQIRHRRRHGPHSS